MSQSNVIFAAIFVAYLIFITMRGEVPIYLGLLLKSPPQQNIPASAPGVGTQSANSTAGQVGTAAAQAVLMGLY